MTTASQGMFESRNGGESWTRVNDAVGLLAWPAAKRLYLIDGEGTVRVSSDGGRTLTTRGEVGGQPAALLAVKDELLRCAARRHSHAVARRRSRLDDPLSALIAPVSARGVRARRRGPYRARSASG